MSAPNDLKLIRALDALSVASDLVEGIYLAGCGLGSRQERGAIIRLAALASSRIGKAKRKIDQARAAEREGAEK